MSIDKLKIEKFGLDSTNMLNSLIDCYKDAFAYLPWEEWKYCDNCNQKFGKENQDILFNLQCPHCKQKLRDFWPHKTVEEDIIHELSHPLSSCYVLTQNNMSVVGFCWGYTLTSRELEEHLELPGTSQALQNNFPGKNKVAYQDEIGILKEFQGQKLAKLLFQARLADFKNWGIDIGVVRTKTLPATVTYLWYLRLGYKIIKK